MPETVQVPASPTLNAHDAGLAFSPTPFGKYWLIDRIATGGMAEIFLAKTFAHGGFESTFVLKRILPHLGADDAFIDMFVTEAKVSVGLQHPNIVRVFDFGSEGQHFFIAMEHIAGRDLRRLLKAVVQAGEKLPLPLALYVASEACKGLHFAHTRTSPDGAPLGIVHRDISPSNLLLSWDGDVKLADFGIARADWAATDDEGLKGKYEYMSPEQADGRAIDARSDIFSLGVTLYEMITGKRAFKGKDDEETLRRLAAVDLDRPRAIIPDLPDAVEQIVLRALAPMPAARYASAREMGEALRKALEPLGDDAAREQLSSLLRGRFTAEIGADATRLEARTRLAQARAAELPAADTLVEAEGPPTTASEAMHGRLIGGLVVALVGMLALLGMVWWDGQQRTEVPDVSVAATGSLEVEVTPKAKFYVSGRLVGEDQTFQVKDLAPGDYEVRLEAEGHRAVLETVRVTRGGATRFARTLAVLGADAPTVQFTSRPAGASVVIDGKNVGVTPLDWKDGEPGKAYDIELRLDGYASTRGRVDNLVASQTQPFNRTLDKVDKADEREPAKPEKVEPKPEKVEPKPEKVEPKPEVVKPAGTGNLKVVLMGATWATVYVDGRKLSRQAPFSAESLPVGDHLIKVENPASGLSVVQRVTVTPGATATVRAVAQ